MFAEERQEQILELLKRNKRVSNTELIKKFGVSGTTIRIDLTELEQKGLLSRTHGGAILKEDPVYGEDSISSRREKNKEAKILIIEDNASLRDMLKKIFETFYNVMVASNGAEGWEIIQAEHPNLVLSDVVMPIL